MVIIYGDDFEWVGHVRVFNITCIHNVPNWRLFEPSMLATIAMKSTKVQTVGIHAVYTYTCTGPVGLGYVPHGVMVFLASSLKV